MSWKPVKPLTLMSRIERLEYVVGTLISWIAQGSTSAITVKEAADLLKMLEEDPR